MHQRKLLLLCLSFMSIILFSVVDAIFYNRKRLFRLVHNDLRHDWLYVCSHVTTGELLNGLI